MRGAARWVAYGRARALTPDPLAELGASLWKRVTRQSRRTLPVHRNAVDL